MGEAPEVATERVGQEVKGVCEVWRVSSSLAEVAHRKTAAPRHHDDSSSHSPPPQALVD